jgi:hypothetical protein
METIYSRYREGSPSFEGTLRLLQELLTDRMLPGYRRIWVQGYSGKSMIVFTLFYDTDIDGRSYRMEFITLGGLRQYRPISDLTAVAAYETEVRLMEELILRLRDGILSGVIS